MIDYMKMEMLFIKLGPIFKIKTHYEKHVRGSGVKYG